MKLTIVTFLLFGATCNAKFSQFFNNTNYDRNLQDCAAQWEECDLSDCCEGLTCEAIPGQGSRCIMRERSDCNCDEPEQECDFQCPLNSDTGTGLCARTIDDCKCAAGNRMRESTCFCRKECPVNSRPKKGVDCPRIVPRECVCMKGYHFVGKECQCKYKCPENSRPAKDCPKDFNDCQCKLGYYKNDDICDVDVVLEWNLAGIRANLVDHGGREADGDKLSCTQGPPRAALQLAVMHLAMFDAYNSIDPQYEEYLTTVTGDDVENASTVAAVAQAARDVLVRRYPAQTGFFDMMLEETFRRVPDGPARDEGIRIGTEAAAAVLEERAEDMECEYGKYEYEDESVIPAHQDDPVYPANQVPVSPNFGTSVKPFVIDSIEQFTGVAPPLVTSEEYAEAHEQVRNLGANGVDSRTTRNYEGTVIAWFHSYNASPGLGTPNILLNEVARVVSNKERLTPEENVRLFALLNVAMANGGIASWREKFDFNFWRPVVGIRNADRDGNPDTVHDPDWVPLAAARSNPFDGECNFSPPFPAYTSGHATFCGAGMKTLINFFGTNDIEFDFKSKEFNGRTFDDHGRIRPELLQKFRSLSVFSSQCAASRVFNGVHWSFDGTVGAREGYDIADYLWENSLRPLGEETKSYNEGVPSIKKEINDILKGRIGVELSSPDSRNVRGVVTNYLKSPAKRRACRGAPPPAA